MSKYTLQSTASECGLACIATVTSHFGYDIELSDLRQRITVSMRGASLDELMKISSHLKFSSRPLRCEVDELDQLQTPCILHWNLNHFVVLLKVGRKGIEIHDPAIGLRHIKWSDVDKQFTGIALELTPAPDFQRKKSTPPIPLANLIGRVVGWKRSAFQLILFASGLQVIGLVTPFLMQWVVDHAIVSADLPLLWVLIGGMLLLMLVQQIVSSGRGYAGIALSNQMNVQWSSRVMGHLVRLPMDWFEKRHIGDIQSRFQSLKTIQDTLTSGLIEALLDGVFALVTLVFMIMYAPGLSGVVVASVVGYFIIRVLSYGPLQRASSDYLILASREQSYFLESIRGIQSIKLAGLEERRRGRWVNLLVGAANRRVASDKMHIGFRFAYGMLFGIENAIVIGWGSWIVITGSGHDARAAGTAALSVGMLLAFVSYKDQFTSRMQNFIDRAIDLRMLRLQVERLADIVLARREVLIGTMPDGANVPDNKLDPDSGITITLSRVSFRYGQNEPWVLRNLSMSISAGEHVAIVGPSGCGKSTLVKLLLGLLDPTEGTILVNNVPLKQFGYGNWRRYLGSVLQDDQLFSGSLQDNIASFSDSLDVERLENCAKLAGIHEEIMAMPMAYHTLNGDMGSTLSGGQKQRVLLARAMYREPQVLILDEATSALDVARERRVTQAISSLKISRVVIAHRPETISMADRVIDLERKPRPVPERQTPSAA